MAANRHLTRDERQLIEDSLKKGLSFKAIARSIGCDCTTISKEIKSHVKFEQTGGFGRAFHDCSRRKDCTQSSLPCGFQACTRELCRQCKHCIPVCPVYSKEICGAVEKPPYCCNGCPKRQMCTLTKVIYKADYAHKEYKACLSESRTGPAVSEDEMERLDAIVSPLLRQGHSVYSICRNHRDEIMLSDRTLYNYINLSMFSARRLDMPRAVRYRPRKSRRTVKVDRKCRNGRERRDFEKFIQENPDVHIVEMDSVEGRKGGSVLLTIHFTSCRLMLAFIRGANTAKSVSDIFESLYAGLGPELFKRLFQIIRTDNGSEFSNPSAAEFDQDGRRRARIFYCDPSASYQKGACENNHEMIRRIIPKGVSMDGFSQNDISKMMSHINSYPRKSLGGQTPCHVFESMFGSAALQIFGIEHVKADDVTLDPSLLKKPR